MSDRKLRNDLESSVVPANNHKGCAGPATQPIVIQMVYDETHANTPVIPAKAGIQPFVSLMYYGGLDTGLRRYDDFQNTSTGALPRPFLPAKPRQCSIFTLNG